MPGGSPPRALAGVVARRAASPDRLRARVEAALGPVGPRRVFVDGPIVVAWTGGQPGDAVETDERLCVVDGTVYDLDALAAAVGADARAGPAAVVTVAQARWGEAAFARLRGDFVLLSWDRRARRGVLVRDHMGGRGIAFAEYGVGLAFASEVAQVLSLLPSQPPPDEVAAGHWINVGGQPGGRTLFAGLRRLEAGHLMPLDTSPPAPRRYWSPPYREPLRAPRGELVARLRDELTRAVGRRAGPGDSTGLLLSGGLDSASVAALAALALEPGRRPHAAYSAVFPTLPGVDESEQIDALTAAYAMPGVRIAVRGGSVLAGSLPYLARWRLPPTSPNMFFWSPLLARAGADGTRVLLDGEGGDEVFGLSVYLLADRIRQGRLLGALALARRLPGGPRSARNLAQLLRTFAVKGAAPAWMHTVSRRAHGPGRYALDWTRPSTARVWLETENNFGWKRYDGPRWWSYLVDSTIRGLGADLVYDQSRWRAAMAGIESRHPLVDVDVMEFVLRLPPELAYDPRHSRPLLREAMAGLVPDAVRLRPAKSSFDALFHQAMAGGDLPVARRLLGDPQAHVGAYADLAVVRQALLDRDPPAPGRSRQAWAIHVWRLLTLEVWLRAQADPAALDDLARDPALTGPDVRLIDAPPGGPGRGAP